MERAGAAICTNSPRRDAAEIARRHALKKTLGQTHAWGTLGHCGRVQALEKLEIVSYYVSRAGPSRSRLKAPEQPKVLEAPAGEGTINPRER